MARAAKFRPIVDLLAEIRLYCPRISEGRQDRAPACNLAKRDGPESGWTGSGPEMFGRRTVTGFVLPASPEILTVTSSEDTAMPTGTIARLLIDKGFGFIRDESGVEHFFHRSAVRGAVFELLREGQRVEFVPEESGKGPRAGDIRLIEN